MKSKKSVIAHVCSRKIWLRPRMMLPFVSVDTYDPKQHCKYTCKVLMTSRKFFHASQSKASCSLKTSFGTLKSVWLAFTLNGSMKSKKSVTAHVCSRKIWLRPRMMFPFVSVDTYDPKQHCKYTCKVLMTSRKFFHAPQSKASCSLRTFFLDSQIGLTGFHLEREYEI